ncbi:stealth family protein [Demequina sp. NBRC 110056]|uniref:stealth family protein n=1 Tax=Demequina sp. NBRC 110056 TaxID=1570345 RepID=UPI00117D03FC|nr:stealth family protein [Demequina sp. NBRC 110056]
MTVDQLARYLDWKWERLRARESKSPSVPARRGYSSGDVVRENLAQVRAALDDAHVRHLVMPELDSFRPILVVSERDGDTVRGVLEALPADEGWVVRTREAKLVRSDVAVAGNREGGLLSARVYRNVDGPDRRLTTRAETVTVLVFTRLDAGVLRADGDEFQPGTLHRHPQHPTTPIAYFEPQEWATWSGDGEFDPDWPPLIGAVIDPIDVVYTWVDGSDPAWLARKARRTGDVAAQEYSEAADVPSRYASRDELRYSLRSLEMYAPWVRHIYLVTDRQRPAWLVEDHPRITVVDHSEIFSDPTVLPVFNSHAIESQLHHVPGLSDRYLYLNDDIMFARPVSPRVFFGPGGVTKFFRSKAVLDVAPPTPRDLPVLSAAKNNRQLVLDRFRLAVTQKFKHTPHPQRKDVLEEMEAEIPELFEQTQRSALRHPHDISIASALHHYWAYASGRAHEGEIRYGYIDLAREDVDLQLARLRHRRDLDVFCLNETNASSEQAAHLDAALPAFLESMFPVPSTFERP